MQLETRLHHCLAADRPAFGSTAMLTSAEAVELIARHANLDWMMFEMQHLALDVLQVVHRLRALQAADPTITPFARLPSGDHVWIEQTLDAGFTGLIIPQVESAEQARAIASAGHYPPTGSRSWAGSVRALTIYDNYQAGIDEHLILLPQIESVAGLENCEAIINEPGIHGVLLGPGDLSLSHGWPMNDMWSRTPFCEAVKRVADACTAAGKIAATLMTGDDAKRAIDAGYRMIGVSGDAVVIRSSMATNINSEIASLHDS